MGTRADCRMGLLIEKKRQTAAWRKFDVLFTLSPPVLSLKACIYFRLARQFESCRLCVTSFMRSILLGKLNAEQSKLGLLTASRRFGFPPRRTSLIDFIQELDWYVLS